MVKNQTGRTLNRIYAAIYHSSCVAKTMIAMHLAQAFSRQLPVPTEQQYEDETVTLNDNRYHVMRTSRLIDLDSQENRAQPLAIDPSKANGNQTLVDRQTIREAMVSADHPIDRFPYLNLRFSSTSNQHAVAKIESIHYHFVNSIPHNGKHSLTSLLADTLGSVADRIAFTIHRPPMLDAHVRSIDHCADVTPDPVKSDLSSTSGDRSRLSDIRQARAVGIDIKIHMAALTLTPSRRRPKKSLAQSMRQHRVSSVAIAVPSSQKIAKTSAFKRKPLSDGEMRREFSATHAYQKLVERIYDG